MKSCLKAQSDGSTLSEAVTGIASTLGCGGGEVSKSTVYVGIFPLG